MRLLELSLTLIAAVGALHVLSVAQAAAEEASRKPRLALARVNARTAAAEERDPAAWRA